MIFKDSNYRIEGFCPGPDTDFDKWNFSIGLKKGFAKRAFEVELPSDSFKKMNNMAEIIVKRNRLGGNIGSHYCEFTGNKTGNLTLLSHSCNVPGNATHLSLEGIELPEALKISNEYDEYLVYNPHNIDSIFQASALLSNWIRWYECAEAMLSS